MIINHDARIINKLVVQSYKTTAKQFKRNYDTQVQQSNLFVI